MLLATPEIHSSLTLLGQAQATFERERAALYRADGEQRYGDAEHTERLAAMAGTLNKTIESAQQVADRVIAEQSTLLTHLTHGDAYDALTPTERTAAATAQVFAKEDAETLPAAELIARCKAALAGSDKSTMYLFARYVGQRVTAANEEAATTPQEGQYAVMALEDRKALGSLVDELRVKVRGHEGTKKAEAARGQMARAQELRTKTISLYDAVHQPSERTKQHMLASGRYEF